MAVIGCAVALLAGCVTLHGDIPHYKLYTGTTVVEWTSQDQFIYRRQKEDPLKFQPSFMDQPIDPEDIYTDGGSIPQILWGIPGLSPWGLGPAYIIHDYLFVVHRCGWPVPPHIAKISFDDSAKILAELGKALIERNLVKDDMLDAIVWAIKTRYAQHLWDTPLSGEACERPKSQAFMARQGIRVQTVWQSKIPPKIRSVR
jgi:hypothetical protein